MINDAGSGFSRWHDLAVTRWREDPTCDPFGSYVLLSDLETRAVWSSAVQPCSREPATSTANLTEGRAEFSDLNGLVAAMLEVAVARDIDAEVRRVTIANHGNTMRELDVTSYAELVLGSAAADAAHPAFSKRFVQTEWVEQPAVLLATRRKRSPDEAEVWAAHLAVTVAQDVKAYGYETDRARFLGRGGHLRSAVAMEHGTLLSNTVGAVLDPVFSLRRRLRIAPGETARVAFWTSLAHSRDEVLSSCKQLCMVDACERAFADAMDYEKSERARLGIDARQAECFQHLVAPLLYADAAWRSPQEMLERGTGGAPVLWVRGISGDRPIVLMRIADQAHLDHVRELLLAQRYWQSKGLGVDVVMLNTARDTKAEALQAMLEALQNAQMALLTADPGVARAEMIALRDEEISAALHDGLATVARIVIDPSSSELAKPARRELNVEMPRVGAPGAIVTPVSLSMHASARVQASPPGRLEFDNGMGGFARNDREYVIKLAEGRCTPMPWINVVANASFGFIVSAEGGGYTWSVNSQQNALTPWTNDPVSDSPHEVLYMRDEDSGELWSATPLPIRFHSTIYSVCHGKGYSRFAHDAHSIELELLQWVPADDSIKLSRLRLRNRSGRTRRLSVTAYIEWALGANGTVPAPFVVTTIDAETGALFARNAWRPEFGERVAFADLNGMQASWTADRSEFLGIHGAVDRPAALASAAPLSGRVGAGLDPCAALQTRFELAPEAQIEVVFTLGEAASLTEAQTLVAKYRAADLDKVLNEARGLWDDVLGVVQVHTPDPAMDLLLNDWLLYQVLGCRVWARTAFYQSSGAYGFRDQLQDVMALCVARPDVARQHLLRAAARQFVEGDVQHWWLPPAGQGLRTRMTDDRIWLPYVAAHFIDVTGDAGVLDVGIPFLAGGVLKDGQVDAFFLPTVTPQPASLYEHCARALDVSLSLGTHGLPLMGTGDWNDGMNRVGAQGRGESVWLAWFLIAAIDAFVPYAEARGDGGRIAAWRECKVALRVALESAGWDGQWYRRGYYDDGTPLGSSESIECRIDGIAQSWSVISGAGDLTHATQAMAAVEQHLIRRDDRIALLLTPPFDCSPLDPGYIKGYPPGIRENGGQYTHGAIWSIFAFATLGQGDRAAELFAILNPIHHGSTADDVARYQVEPYAACADVYSVPPHVGRGGWTWYTGSAGWLYRAGLQSILGFRVHANTLTIDPCLPSGWAHYEIVYRRRGPQDTITRYEIAVDNPQGVNRGVVHMELDTEPMPDGAACIPLANDGRIHHVRVLLGRVPRNS
jgi:cyclic beta-1,2-glucan synthetase